MIDLPLTHFRPDEVGITVEQAIKLGYERDLFGTPLVERSQVIQLHPQDILVSEICADYLIKITRFIDMMLVKCYNLSPFYNVRTKSDLLGHLVMGLAPHTSAGYLRASSVSRRRMLVMHTHFSMLQSEGTVSTVIR